MRRRLALAASTASILSLFLAATVLAGGWANAVMDTPPNDPGGPNQPVTLPAAWSFGAASLRS